MTQLTPLDSPPQIPEHVTWSERNSRRLLYGAYTSHVHRWLPVSPTISRITGTKHTQRNADIRREVLAGTDWIIQNRMKTVVDSEGNQTVLSWYRLTTKQRAASEPVWPEGAEG